MPRSPTRSCICISGAVLNIGGNPRRLLIGSNLLYRGGTRFIPWVGRFKARGEARSARLRRTVRRGEVYAKKHTSETPIGRFITLNPRDGEALALPGKAVQGRSPRALSVLPVIRWGRRL